VIVQYRGTPLVSPGSDRVLVMRVGPPYAAQGEAVPVVTPPIVRVDTKARVIHCKGITYVPERNP